MREIPRSISFVWLFSALLGLVFLAVCAFLALDSEQDAERRAQTAAANLTQAISRDVARTFQSFDLSVAGAVEAFQKPNLEKAPPDIQQLALFDYATKAPYLNRVSIIDETGLVVADSIGDDALLGINLSDRDYFTFHRDTRTRELHVSRPFRSRINGEWVLSLSRAILKPDGAFGGIVNGTMSLNYFSALFANLQTDPDDAFDIFNSDGVLIMRSPFRLTEIGRDLRDWGLVKAFPSEAAGFREAISVVDGVRRLYSYSAVPNLPLVVAVGVSKANVIASWRNRVAVMAAMMLTLWAAMLALWISLARELNRRRRAEAQLRQAADQLAHAAATDGLTGIANRRAFDKQGAREWRRAARARTPLSLLLIDVDFFKSYNDRHGHLAGDNVLKQVAARITDAIGRPGDFAARFGGEEFAVLLPETGGAGASDVAEAIRQIVSTIQPQESASPITVSIGLSTRIPARDDLFDELIDEADMALYRAKANGRNRVEADSNERSMRLRLVS